MTKNTLTKKNILIVDDNEAFVQVIIKTILLQYKDLYNYFVAVDGDEALKCMYRNPIDLVLLDIRMQNLDGMQVCHEKVLDEQIRSIPVIISSGYLNGKDKNRLKALGVHHFLRKPYEMKELFNLISSILRDK